MSDEHIVCRISRESYREWCLTQHTSQNRIMWLDTEVYKRWISFVTYVWFLFCWCIAHKEGNGGQTP